MQKTLKEKESSLSNMAEEYALSVNLQLLLGVELNVHTIGHMKY